MGAVHALGLPAPDLREGIWQLSSSRRCSCRCPRWSLDHRSIPQFAVVAVAAVLFISLLASEARHYVERLPAGWLPPG